MEIGVTKHASVRVRQRRFRESDLTTILENGTPARDGVLLTRKDVADRISECRKTIDELERLSGAAVFLEDGQIASVYRPAHRKAHRMIRQGRGRVVRPRPERKRRSWR
jgi:hypothetical protein